MQHPRLYLGLMGFDAPAEARVRSWLTANAVDGALAEGSEHPVWQVVDFREADALLICGAGVATGCETQLQFHLHLQAAQYGAPLGADLESIKQPFAISDVAHLQSLGMDVKNYPVFDLQSPSEMQRTLQIFEAVLRPLRTLFALAVELNERREELDAQHTFHLERNGILDAIVDVPRRRALIRPGARPVDIHTNAWQRRPKSANYPPAHFLECSTDELAWVFGLYSQQVALPKRYASKRIYVRHSPRVRASLIYARHAAVLERLCHGGATLEQLRQELPAIAHWLERDLFSLYLVRSITTAAPADKSAGLSSLPQMFDNTAPASALRGDKVLSTISAQLQPLL